MINAVSTLSSMVSSQTGVAQKPVSGTANAGQSFTDILAEAGRTAKSTMDHAESVSMQSLRGTFDPRVVADAVMSAERTLQTAVVVRDKIVTAYLEISRMAI